MDLTPQKLSKLPLMQQVEYHLARAKSLEELFMSGRQIIFYREEGKPKLRVRFNG